MAKKQSLYYPSEDYLRFVPSDVLSKNKKRPLTQRTSMDYLRFIPQIVLDTRKKKEEEGLSTTTPVVNTIPDFKINLNKYTTPDPVRDLTRFNRDMVGDELSLYDLSIPVSQTVPSIDEQRAADYVRRPLMPTSLYDLGIQYKGTSELPEVDVTAPVITTQKVEATAETPPAEKVLPAGRVLEPRIEPIRTSLATKPIDYTGGRKLTDTDLGIKQASKGGLEPYDYANIASGVLGITGALGSLYGAVNASKQEAVIIPPQAKIEAAKIEDRTAAQKAAGEEDIDKAIRTAAAQQERLGLYGGGLLVGKETEAKNRLAGTLAGMQLQTDAQNAQLEQQANTANQQLEYQRGAANAQLMNRQREFNSSLMSQGISGSLESITSSANSLFQNMITKQTKSEAQQAMAKINEENEINNLINLMNSGMISDTDRALIYKKIKEYYKV